MRRTRVRSILSIAAPVLLFVGIFLVRGGYFGELINRVGETGSPVSVHQLNDIGTLQQAFNHDAGTPRLILLVSPT
ncbi:MAG TPA: hypothetical protein VIT43_00095 [Candidatus Dormibacteraeota bacterium]